MQNEKMKIIREKFILQAENDSRKFSNFNRLVDWTYQSKKQHGEIKSNMLVSNMSTSDFKEWMEWVANAKKVFQNPPLLFNLIEPIIKSNISQFIKTSRLSISKFVLQSEVHYSIFDYIICGSILNNIKGIIDYGAGYGRNIFTFGMITKLPLCLIDSVEKNYVMQSFLIKQYFNTESFEYLDYPDVDKNHLENMLRDNKIRIIHIPGWRLDLIPFSFFNLLILSWVFHEINRLTAQSVLDNIIKEMDKKSYVFFRGTEHKISHKLNFNREMKKRGFKSLIELVGDNKLDKGMRDDARVFIK